MIHHLEDKMSRDEDFARRERRMAEFRERCRQRFGIAHAPPPLQHVETTAGEPCDVYRVDTSEIAAE